MTELEHAPFDQHRPEERVGDRDAVPIAAGVTVTVFDQVEPHGLVRDRVWSLADAERQDTVSTRRSP